MLRAELSLVVARRPRAGQGLSIVTGGVVLKSRRVCLLSWTAWMRASTWARGRSVLMQRCYCMGVALGARWCWKRLDIGDSGWRSMWMKRRELATGHLVGIAGSATAMPMVRVSHERLSSLVCDCNRGRGRMVVDVAAHHHHCTFVSRRQGCPKIQGTSHIESATAVRPMMSMVIVKDTLDQRGNTVLDLDSLIHC